MKDILEELSRLRGRLLLLFCFGQLEKNKSPMSYNDLKYLENNRIILVIDKVS